MTNKLKNLFFLLILLLFPACNSNKPTTPQKIHKAHLTQGWYPQDEKILNTQIDEFLNFCKNKFDVAVDPQSIKAIIAPHAGYSFSGICAASAYQNLLTDKQKNKNIKKVIVLSPTHTRAFKGISLPDFDVYQTALGDINVDTKAIETLKENNLFTATPDTHEEEHAIEVQLPFLQKTIENFTLIPIIVGHLEKDEYDSAAKTLQKIIDDSTLIVISSDFIHHGSNYRYAPFTKDILDSIRFVDSLAIEAVIQKSFDQFDKVLRKTEATICGQNSIKILIKLLQSNVWQNLETRLCCYYTSPQIEQSYKKYKGLVLADSLLQTVPDKLVKNSVSYLGMLFTSQKLDSIEKQNQLTDYEKKSLPILARRTIENSFKDEKVPEHLLFPIKSLGLQQSKGAFVTLETKDGNLRGCIGNIVTRNPLFVTVQEMSKSAAFHDTRFKPLQKNELGNIVIDISVLTEPKPVKSYNDIEIGKHGIILKKQTTGGRWTSAVFLPQIPPSFGWNLDRTLEQLSLKAGLAKDAWKQDCEFEVFQGFEIHEQTRNN